MNADKIADMIVKVGGIIIQWGCILLLLSFAWFRWATR